MRIFGIEITGARIVGAAIVMMTIWGSLQIVSMVVTLTGRIAGM